MSDLYVSKIDGPDLRLKEAIQIPNLIASNVFGTVAVANGGTGGTTVAAARGNLGVPAISVQASEPSSKAVGDLWQDTGDNKLYVYNGTSWYDSSGGAKP